jgi:acetylornithine/succinyldiaminopimelate/putrescine aminotransferase
MTTQVNDLRWPTYPGRGLMLDAAVFDDADQPGALRVRDVGGKVYLDGVAGVGCAVLGHGHRAWAEAIHRQLEKLTSVANTFYTVPQQQLAARLAELFPLEGGTRSFFANTGTETTEAAIKLALRATGRDTIIAFERAFHGRTLGSIALTANAAYREPYVSILGEEANRFARMNVLRLPFGDVAALEDAFREQGKRIAAVFVEPVQGEGGIYPATKAFLLAMRDLCDRHGALLGCDEVQSGCGRTGDWSAWQTIVGDEAKPDIVWLAKALGGGFPIGACLTSAKLSASMGSGTHGTTFGGNPVACVAALATLRLIEEEGLLAKARAQTPTLQAIAAADPIAEVLEIRGLGAMIGVQVGAPAEQRAKQLGAALIDEGVLTTTPGYHTVRLLLPYAAGEKELREFWAALRRALAATA